MSDLARRIATSGMCEVRVHRQVGLDDVRRVPVRCHVGVAIDIDALIDRLGEKALRSKGKRATAFYGALVVDVREALPESPAQ